MRLLPLALVIFALPACGSDREPAGLAPLHLGAFDRAVESFLADKALPGATAVVVHRDRGIVHLRGYGSFDKDRVVLIASAGKVLSASVLLALAEQGVVDLDAPISTYLGKWGQHKTDITLAQMLSNSAGLVGLTDQAEYSPYICQYLHFVTMEDCGQAIYTAADAADRVPPDTRFRYGGGQWQLAGAVAEQASGRTWAELVEEKLRKPCGLNVLGYTNQFAEAYSAMGGDEAGGRTYPATFGGDVTQLPLTRNPSVEGGAYTTAADYGELLLAQLRGGRCGAGRVLSEASVARMQQDRIGKVYGGSTGDAAFPGYGLGWWVSRDQPGYLADPGAYGATPWIDLQRGYGVLILVEASGAVVDDLLARVKPVVDATFDAAR